MEHGNLAAVDVADIVKRAREFLEEHGPSQEEDLCRALGARRARRVWASFGSLAAWLSRQPGFHPTCEGEHSYVYYLDPRDCDGPSGGNARSSKASPPAALVPDRGRQNASSDEVKVANGFSEEHAQEGSHSSPSLTEEAAVVGASLREQGVEEELLGAVGPLCREDSPTFSTGQESLPETAVKSRCTPAAALALHQAEALNVEHPRVPEFVELHVQLQHSGAGTSYWHRHRESNQGGPSGCVPMSRSVAQLVRVVKQVKRKMPHLSEAEIRCHMDHVRCIRGGFSFMTLLEIEALVLDYMKYNGEP